MNLTLTSDVVDHVLRVRIVGDIDYATSGRLLSIVADLQSQNPGTQELHLDCAELDFCDSAGLSAILAIHRDASASGQQLWLDNRPPLLDRLLELTGLLEFLTSRPN